MEAPATDERPHTVGQRPESSHGRLVGRESAEHLSVQGPADRGMHLGEGVAALPASRLGEPTGPRWKPVSSSAWAGGVVTVPPVSWASRLLRGSPSMGPPGWLELRAGWGPGGSSCRAVGLWGAFLEDGVLAEGRPVGWGWPRSTSVTPREYGLGQGLLHLGNRHHLSWGQRKSRQVTEGDARPRPSLLSERGRGGKEHGWDPGHGARGAGNRFFLSLRLVGELTSFVVSKSSVPRTVRPLCVQEPFSAFPEQHALCPGASTGLAPASRGPAAQWAPPRAGVAAGPQRQAPPCPVSPCLPVPPLRLQGLAGVAALSVCFCVEVRGGPLWEPQGPGRHVPL